MKHLQLVIIIVTVFCLMTGCQRQVETSEVTSNQVDPSEEIFNQNESSEAKSSQAKSNEVSSSHVEPILFIHAEGKTVQERFVVPEGYERIETQENSFGHYLQNLPLKEDGAKVKYFDGREKSAKAYLAVVDFSLGDRDLQQCADAVIRLRAEYLYEQERFDDIHFNFVSGFKADYVKWSQGYGISVTGNEVSWVTNSRNDASYESFEKYLNVVYAYASTLSLEQELIAKSIEELAIGDVFIIGGSPGHCVIVVDMAINTTTGEKLFMLAQSYMPAQDIQILRGDEDDSPWYALPQGDTLITPEWRFQTSELKTFLEAY